MAYGSVITKTAIGWQTGFSFDGVHCAQECENEKSSDYGGAFFVAQRVW